MPTVNVTRVAAFLNLTEQRVQQLVKERVLPREARGLYDPIKCSLAYIRYLQRALEKKTEPTLNEGILGEREAQVRLLRADADFRETELGKQRSELVALTDVEKIVGELVWRTTAEIMAVPSRVAPDLVGEKSRMMIQAKVDKACKETLKRLAAGPKLTPFEGAVLKSQ